MATGIFFVWHSFTDLEPNESRRLVDLTFQKLPQPTGSVSGISPLNWRTGYSSDAKSTQ
jgi:hypothetical protein